MIVNNERSNMQRLLNITDIITNIIKQLANIQHIWRETTLKLLWMAFVYTIFYSNSNE